MDLAEKRRLRTEMMQWLYFRTDGDEDEIVDLDTFRFTIPYSAKEIDTAVMYLEGEGLLNSIRGGGDSLPSLRISHAGVSEVEAGLADIDKQTQHFVPFGTVNIINVSGDFSAKQFQQSASHSSQVIGISSKDFEAVKNLITALKEQIDQLGISAESKREVTEDITLIEKELLRSDPRKAILRTCFETLRQIVVTGSASLAVQGILAMPWPAF